MSDIGEFCRRVEEHLARVNEGQIVRVVGPAFELVRGWALEGIPLSVVARGIDLKADRHRVGRSTRPLRLEFCEADVREVFTRWRRSVGLTAPTPAPDGTGEAVETEKRPSLSRQLDRALDRLSRVAGRLDLPEAFRDEVSQSITELSSMRESIRSLRGDARKSLVARLPSVDTRLVAAGRDALARGVLDRLRGDAERDLGAYRARLAPDAWTRSVDRALDQLVRDHLGLPTLRFES